MALYYQTEYRLGRRYGRITRSYTGFQAFLAIVLDLVFGLFFELITGAIALALRLIYLTLQTGFAVLRKSWSTLDVRFVIRLPVSAALDKPRGL